MVPLSAPNFWSVAEPLAGTLMDDGSLRYVLLDRTFRMRPLIRDTRSLFTEYLMANADAKRCKVIVNTSLYGATLLGKLQDGLGLTSNPDSTLVHGLVVVNGTAIGGTPEPERFSFEQITVPTRDAFSWTFAAAPGDPVLLPSTIAGVGGAGPLIVGSREYGVTNRYSPGAPAGTTEPERGQPPPEAMPHLIRRSNATFASQAGYPQRSGKSILAYCQPKRMLLVAVQPDDVRPGQKMEAIASDLAKQGFTSAVFFDGGDSATLIYEGKIIVSPAPRKDRLSTSGVGFYK